MKLVWYTKRDITATVGELIKELQKFDPYLPVLTEGCDCSGNVVGTEFFESEDGDPPYLLIRRDDWATRGGTGCPVTVSDEYKDRVEAMLSCND